MVYKFINIEYLEMISGGDPDIINEIVVMFKDQVKEMHSDMISLLARKDYFALGLLAHKAKSSVAIMGMNDLASMLKTFETKGREGKEIELYESFITRFKTDTEAAVTELEDMVCNLLNKSK